MVVVAHHQKLQLNKQIGIPSLTSNPRIAAARAGPWGDRNAATAAHRLIGGNRRMESA